MSALPLHGGGVTLNRILGEDLKCFDWFAEVLHFSHEPFPSYEDSRSHIFPWWSGELTLRRFIGSRPAWSLYSSLLSKRIFAKQVARRLRKLEPEIGSTRLLVCPQGVISLLVVDELLKRSALEYITWIMDDHVVRHDNGGWSYPAGMEEVMLRHLTHAQQIYVISHAMSEFYKEHFGVDSEVLCGSGEIPGKSKAWDATHGENRPLQMAYFGSLGPWQNDAIELLADPIRQGRIQLDLFTRDAEKVPESLRLAGCGLRSPIPAEKVVETACIYDALVLPISFRPEMRQMSELNYATKFAESLGVPVPILLIGPPYAAMVSCARRAGACVVVDEATPEAVEAGLSTLRCPDSRKAIIESEAQLLRREFSQHVMQLRWQAGRDFLWPNGHKNGNRQSLMYG